MCSGEGSGHETKPDKGGSTVLHDDMLYMNVGILCRHVGMHVGMHVAVLCPLNAIDMLEMLCMLTLTQITPISLFPLFQNEEKRRKQQGNQLASSTKVNYAIRVTTLQLKQPLNVYIHIYIYCEKVKITNGCLYKLYLWE